MSNAREKFVQELEAAKLEIKTAGPIHRRDLQKHIRDMERELRDYDRFQKDAACKGRISADEQHAVAVIAH